MSGKRKTALYAIMALLCLLMLGGCSRADAASGPRVSEAPSGLPEDEGSGDVIIIDGGAGGSDVRTNGVKGPDGGVKSNEAEKAQEEKKEKIPPSKAVLTKEPSLTFTAVDEMVYVMGDRVNIRKSPETGGEVIGTVTGGTALKRTGVSDKWSRINYGQQECYIASAYVSKEQSAPVPKVEGTGSGKIIAIDPGHQAKGDPTQEPIGLGASRMKAKVASGTQGVVTGIPEYKLTLIVSLKLRDELLKRGYRVYMIRETNDVNISNSDRAKMANGSGADIFVRIHANSLSDGNAAGTLTMCQTPNNPYNGKLYDKSHALSKALAKDISSAAGFKNRGVQTSDAMSGINWCTIPVSIVEMGFMSNAAEDREMATDQCRDKLAKGMADGIDEYYASGN